MKVSGCYRVNLAVESGNQWVLDNIIHKPVKVDKIPEIVCLIRRHGMEPGMFLVVGNIGERSVETIEQIRDSFRLARRVGIIPHVSLLTPYPGSEVLNVAKNKGYLVSGFDWDDLVITKGTLQTPEWTQEELSRLVEQERRKTRRHLVLHRPQMYLLLAWRSLRRDPRGFPKMVSTFVKKLIWS
jgi:magnesium-protoporphyrin IX monomethyl ester (oxidative) cyclase